MEAVSHPGRIRPNGPAIAWTGGLTLAALTLGPLTATPRAVALGLGLTALTLCCGHSVGLHRLLIHRSFQAPRWLERALVYLGTLVGMGGPLSMLAMHNTRDALQSAPGCPDYFAHRAPLWRDYLEQLYGRYQFAAPFAPRRDPAAEADPFYRWLERTWRLQQLPVAVLCYLAAGGPGVVWGVAVRVALSTTGHWFVGHIAHNRGYRNFEIEGVSLQGWNSRLFGALAMGEGWHNNHHAFPHSARLGLKAGELDPGWLFIRLLQRLGLATGVLLPESRPPRHPVRAAA